jgi:hypothetical protein
MNKYKKWYNQIISNGSNARKSGYERHHILPKSLGGTDDKSNITFITAREHFVCHWLLIKIYPTGEEHWKMLNALRMMRAENPNQTRYHTKITSRVYAKLKDEYAKLQSKKVSGENNPMYGNKFYRSDQGKQSQRELVTGEKNGARQEQARKKITDSKIGKKRAPFSQDWINKLKDAHSGENNSMYGKKHTEETRAKQSARATGRKQSEETIKKKADAIRGSRREKQLCPHCNQSIAVNTYARWHGDNCKQNSESAKYIVHS